MSKQKVENYKYVLGIIDRVKDIIFSTNQLETPVDTPASVHYVGDRGDIPYSSSQVFLTSLLVVSKIQY